MKELNKTPNKTPNTQSNSLTLDYIHQLLLLEDPEFQENINEYILLTPKDFSHEDSYIRRLAFEKYDWPIEAKYDENLLIKDEYYKRNPNDPETALEHSYLQIKYFKNHPEKGKEHQDPTIRRIYYKNFPEDKDSKLDSNERVRAYYYECNPEDKDSKFDISENIRSFYYQLNLQDTDALLDKSQLVQDNYLKNFLNNSIEELVEEAHSYKTKEELVDEVNPYNRLEELVEKVNSFAKKSPTFEIRDLYYQKNPEDIDAIYDVDPIIRYTYFINHLNNPEILKLTKEDKSEDNRYLYYKQNPLDLDGLKDKAWSIKELCYKEIFKQLEARQLDH